MALTPKNRYRKSRFWVGGLLILVLLHFTRGVTGALGPEDALERWIQIAGNIDDDRIRLRYLKEMETLPDLSEQTRSEIEKLIEEVDRWVNSKQLAYFSREISRDKDRDFQIAGDSPLYPLTYLYRARILIWYVLESGGLWNNLDRRDDFLGTARGFLESAKEVFPENRIVRMYLGEPIPCKRQYSAIAGAPEWAVYQREGLERLADVIEWWIDNRMQENGEYGGGWGDDCEMWRWWVPILIGFDDPKITQAQASFSRALLNLPHLTPGYMTRLTDVEHSAEDSSDAITPMMHLEPDNEIWQKRVYRLAELMENLWTGTNNRGFLQFKSTYFSANEVDRNPVRACDTVYHTRAMQPALLYWQRTGDERLGRLFATWMDTWVDAAARSERGKPAGILPSAIHWPDGQVGGTGSEWWDPRNHPEASLYRWPSAMGSMTHVLLLTHHMTKKSEYLQPIRSMARIRLDYLKSPSGQPPAPGSKPWCASQLQLSGILAKYRFLTGSEEFDELLARERSPYIAFCLRGDENALLKGLRDNAKALSINFEGYTSEVRYTDRVLRFPTLFQKGVMYYEAVEAISSPNPGLLYSTATGDPGEAGYFPLNAVRWLTPPRDIAALVTKSGKHTFEAQLFHFGEEERRMKAEFYLLEPGEYTIELLFPGDGLNAQAKDFRVMMTGRRTQISFGLPAQKLCLLAIRRLRQ